MKRILLPVQPFLGSHLCDRINEGYFVILDNLITGDLKI
jgi:hypothetical protein